MSIQSNVTKSKNIFDMLSSPRQWPHRHVQSQDSVSRRATCLSQAHKTYNARESSKCDASRARNTHTHTLAAPKPTKNNSPPDDAAALLLLFAQTTANDAGTVKNIKQQTDRSNEPRHCLFELAELLIIQRLRVACNRRLGRRRRHCATTTRAISSTTTRK